MEECITQQQNFECNGTFCEVHWDTFKCWPTTLANTTVSLPCSGVGASYTLKTVSRFCDINGTWKLSKEEDIDLLMVSDSECFTQEISDILTQLERLPNEEYQQKILVAQLVRSMEMIGLFVSLMTLVTSLVIYSSFRNLKNDRSRIHKHLFAAVLCSVLAKLVLRLDQFALGYGATGTDQYRFINTPILCEVVYAVWEYSRSATYIWMFIEAFHLCTAIAVLAVRLPFKRIYIIFGWGLPAVCSIFWIISMVMTFPTHCWFGYNYHKLYWIMEGPRDVVLIANTYYLMMISKVGFVKLQRNNNYSEVEKIRRIAISTLKLFFLFGITDYIKYAEPSLGGSFTYFVLYCIVSCIISSFQGTFLSYLFCLSTSEVNDVIREKVYLLGSCSGLSDTNQSSLATTTNSSRTETDKDQNLQTTAMTGSPAESATPVEDHDQVKKY